MERDTKTRRDFLKTGAAAGTALAASGLRIPGAYAAGSDEIRIGLIGCGGRGRGAVENAIAAADGVRLVAMADVFEDRIAEARERFTELGEAARVADEHAFVGFDAYEKVLASDVNYVILATPPAFRPQHLKAAVAAGKNVFTEKPVSVDAPGIRTCFEVYEEAKRKGLGIGAGTQRRHEQGYLEVMKRVHDGAIGELVAARCYWNQGGLWNKPRQEGWTDVEWQLRNWLYFTWLSGDHIVEQHVHNIDVVNWAMGAHPVKALGMGGRQSRLDPAYGHIFDHFAIDYEYDSGAHLTSMCRQIDGCANRVAEALRGTKGIAETDSSAKRYLVRSSPDWRFRDEQRNPYEQEHVDLIASIRAGNPLNELKTVAESTMTAIMGRMSAYTGQELSWDDALASEEGLVPASLEWGPIETPPVPRPGRVS